MQDEKKYLILGSVLSVLFMFVLVSLPISFLMFFVLLFSLIFYFVIYNKIAKKRHKYMFLIFFMIFCLVLTVLVSTNVSKREHTGSTFTEENNRISQGDIYNSDLDDDFFLLPDKEFFQMKTNYFGDSEVNIDLKLVNTEKSDFDKIYVNLWYYYDGKVDDIHSISNKTKISSSQKSADVVGSTKIIISSTKYSHYRINYLFRVFLILDDDSTLSTIKAEITFDTNISEEDYDVKYSYFIPRTMGVYSGEVEGDPKYDIFMGTELLMTAAFIILFSYLLILGMSFVWQKFEIASAMVIIYVVIGVVLLFWYVSWGMDGHAEEIGLGSTVGWLQTIGVVDDFVNILVFIVTCVQWSITIGMVLFIMLVITNAFSRLFKFQDVTEKIRMNEKIRQLTEKIQKGKG